MLRQMKLKVIKELILGGKMNKILVYGGLGLTILASANLLLFIYGILQPMSIEQTKIMSGLTIPIFFCFGFMYYFGSEFTKKGLKQA